METNLFHFYAFPKQSGKLLLLVVNLKVGKELRFPS